MIIFNVLKKYNGVQSSSVHVYYYNYMHKLVEFENNGDSYSSNLQLCISSLRSHQIVPMPFAHTVLVTRRSPINVEHINDIRKLLN